jgi:hypothetical protein
MELGVALPTSAPYASAESIVRVAQEALHFSVLNIVEQGNYSSSPQSLLQC